MGERSRDQAAPEDDPLWYEDAIIYEVHVRAFHDSDEDGIGDFRGLARKLDYIQDLGVTAIWLLPFYPSPLKDDGYDIADYTKVHPAYGTLRDVRAVVREAHRRGLRVITELVCNHTSDQHPWFQRARRARAGTTWRNYYVWSDTPERYREARIIFKDFETSNWSWDPVANAYYWHRFYSHQPDLNFDNPRVRASVMKVLDFWLRMGVDGLRLDAIPYLYEREGTNSENLPETHAFLKALRQHVDERFENRMILAEANQWPEEAAAYFGDGDECHMAFHFPVMPRLFMSLRMEDRFPIIDILNQTPRIPDNAQWALFLRNHDELTLEMVTDEERDYMYRVYAHDPQMRVNLGIRRRLAPLLGNNRRRIELMNGLLFSLPGTPVIYYGDEIGMGDNIYLGDRNAVRTPMQWSADRNAGFSRASRHRLFLPVIVDAEYHYEAVNVEAQQNNPHSLLWWMKRLIALRKRYKAFGRGTIRLLYPENHKVLVFLRQYEDELILVIANLSRFVQAVELDLSEFQGLVPVEMFGHVEFPSIGELPYFMTLGPHAFYWFSLEPARVPAGRPLVMAPEEWVPTINVVRTWEEAIHGRGRASLRDLLPMYLVNRRWFGGKARRVQSAQVVDAAKMTFNGQLAYLTLVRMEYSEGDAETYFLPLAYTSGERMEQIRSETPHAIVAPVHVQSTGEHGMIFDPVVDPKFQTDLLRLIVTRGRLKGASGKIVALITPAFRRVGGTRQMTLEPSISSSEQSNTSIAYAERFMLKLFRRLEAGINPDLEIGRYLTRRSFAHSPYVVGALEYRPNRGESMTVGILQSFVPNEGDAWTYTLDALGRFFEQAAAMPPQFDALNLSTETLLNVVDQPLPDLPHQSLEGYFEDARLLGQRTAEMHLALASETEDAAFSPEPFTSQYQRSLYQSTRTLAAQTFQALRKNLSRLPGPIQEQACAVLELEAEIIKRLRGVTSQRIHASRIRTHGDYHLGQVLYTGSDFVIIDYEGEPARPLSQRRHKRPPIRDVAGMIRSFHYATNVALATEQETGLVRPEDVSNVERWARFWYLWASVSFLRGYLTTCGEAPFMPTTRDGLRILLDLHMLEKAIYELGYELNNRPDWVGTPLQGILQLMSEHSTLPSR